MGSSKAGKGLINEMGSAVDSVAVKRHHVHGSSHKNKSLKWGLLTVLGLAPYYQGREQCGMQAGMAAESSMFGSEASRGEELLSLA